MLVHGAQLICVVLGSGPGLPASLLLLKTGSQLCPGSVYVWEFELS